jgi:hypothetical protein
MQVALSSMTITRSGGDRPAVVNSYTLGTNPAFLELAFMDVSRNNGPGILNQGQLGLNGSTVTFNTTNGNGGGILNGGGFGQAGGQAKTTVTSDCTIASNHAAGAGGGTYVQTGNVVLDSSGIVTNNTPNNCATADPNNPVANCVN